MTCSRSLQIALNSIQDKVQHDPQTPTSPTSPSTPHILHTTQTLYSGRDVASYTYMFHSVGDKLGNILGQASEALRIGGVAMHE